MKTNSVKQNFSGLNFQLKPETLEHISKSTKLTKNELVNESLEDLFIKAKQRGSLKKQKTIKKYIANLYKKFGERFGLLEKEHLFYTHTD